MDRAREWYNNSMRIQSKDKFVVKTTVTTATNETVSDFLAARSGLSKTKVKEAMNKGAVWVRKKKSGLKRIRRATAALAPGDYLELYYDDKVLSAAPPQGVLLSDRQHYSIWLKPPGLMSQGTMYGDHCSLVRQAEVRFGPGRDTFLVHRLDREASGVMLLAHSREAAARLSELFRKHRIVKGYRVEVLGSLGKKGTKEIIELPLDGKPARTEYEVVRYRPESDTTEAKVVITTGRLHQIRRHFDMIGHPVMGDPKYGTGNKNTEGMRLTAVSLRFPCPFQDREVEFTAPEL
ncbi:MAG: RluA family pseudouridine synthase [Nitrospirota bacterium]